MCYSGYRRTTESGNRQEGSLSATPSGGDAQADHDQTDSPGDKRNTDSRIGDPPRPGFDERPGAAGDGGERDQDEPGGHEARDQLIERGQRREPVIRLPGRLSL